MKRLSSASYFFWKKIEFDGMIISYIADVVWPASACQISSPFLPILSECICNSKSDLVATHDEKSDSPDNKLDRALGCLQKLDCLFVMLPFD